MMDQEIFNLKLTVEGTSLYLLLAAFLSQGQRLGRPQVLSLWNSSEDKLDLAWQELLAHKVVREAEDRCWVIEPVRHWRPSNSKKSLVI